jgi:hypothetical protein
MNPDDAIFEHLTELNAADEVLREFHFAQRLGVLTEFYQREAIRCFEAEALFAASILTASALESLLMQFCLTDKAKVVESTVWIALPKSKVKPFLETLQSKPVTLGFLLNLAKDMSWFPSGAISDQFRSKIVEEFGETNRQEALSFVDDFSSADELFQLMTDLAKDGRNLIHPAVCIREGLELASSTGKQNVVFLVIVLAFLGLKIDQMFEDVMFQADAAAGNRPYDK